MSNKAQKRRLVPKLRFPEFMDSGEWESKPLAKVCNVLQGYGFPEALQGRSNGKYPFCKVSDISRAVAENGGLLAEATNYVGDDELLKLRAKLIPKGATVFAKIGEALRLNRRAYVQKECLIDNNATGLKAINGVAEDYFAYLLSQLIDLNEHYGGAVPSVNKSTLEEIEVVVPGPDEQKRIADCLASLDERITLEAQKLDTLKTHKKGLMQQLFPAEGETLPKLRFPEFRDDGEWEVKTLEDIAKISSGGTPNRAEPDYWGGSIPWITTSLIDFNRIDNAEEFITTEGLKNSSAKLFPAQTLLMAMYGQGKTRGKVALLGIEATANQACAAIMLDKEIDTNFVFQNLASRYNEIRKLSNEGGQENLSAGLIKEIPLIHPCLAEQQKIANCLASLDDLITAQTQKLTALKTHKKGLMQQLFPSVGGVAGEA